MSEKAVTGGPLSFATTGPSFTEDVFDKGGNIIGVLEVAGSRAGETRFQNRNRRILQNFRKEPGEKRVSKSVLKSNRASRHWTVLLAVAVQCSSLCALGDENAARPASPRSVAFAPEGTLVAVGDGTTRAVHLVDPQDRNTRASIQLTGIPEGLVWTPDGKSVFASEAGAGTIAEIDRAAGKVVRRVETGRYPSGLAIARKRGLLLACDRGLDRLTVIAMSGDKPARTSPSAGSPVLWRCHPTNHLRWLAT
jgi:DNA-binding beta-propeller fold protein YncE